MDSYTVLFIAAALLIFVLIKGITDDKKREAKLEKKLRDNYGKAFKREYDALEYDLISHYFKNKGTEESGVIDDITWNDLDMDAVFARINVCRSAAGESMLYYMLRTPCRIATAVLMKILK